MGNPQGEKVLVRDGMGWVGVSLTVIIMLILVIVKLPWSLPTGTELGKNVGEKICPVEFSQKKFLIQKSLRQKTITPFFSVKLTLMTRVLFCFS